MGKSKKSAQVQKCKCCLEKISLKELWTAYFSNGEREIYGEMLTDCFALSWEQPSENTLEYICDNCVARLRDAVSFKKTILYSEQLLIEHTKSESVQNHDVKEEEHSENDIETEYLSIDYIDEDVNDKEQNNLEIKTECDDKSDASPVKDEITFSSNSKRRYTEEDLQKCLEAVRNKTLSQTKASIIYHVPRKTISAALANIPLSSVTKAAPNKNSKELLKRQENLDFLIKYTNVTPFKDVRKGYICYFCLKEYENALDLKNHNLNEHLAPNMLRLKVFTGKSVKLDVTNLKCDICGEELQSLENAFDHLRVLHEIGIHTDAKDHLVPFKFDNEPLKCVVCSDEFSSFKVLNDHINFKHYKNYECGKCGRGFINKRSLQSHGYTHETGEYPCKFCSELFTIRNRLWEHERYVHMKKRKRHKCAYCDERFLDFEIKKKHETDVHDAIRQVFKCRACNNVYCSQKTLNRHVEAFHLLLRPYTCSVCGLGFYKKCELNQHMVKHSGKKCFQCDLCPKSFGRRQTLREHLRVHANDRRFKCEQCEKMFMHRYSWRSHKQTKHGECV